jgi:hypothetical protein
MKPQQAQSKEYKLSISYYNAFSSEAGRAVFKDLVVRFYDPLILIEGKVDALTIAYREGQRSVVLEIINMLRNAKHPEIFERDLDEYIAEE